jgi:putative hydrolase of the HAD superfamily
MIRAVLFDYGMVLSQPAQVGPHNELVATSGLDELRFDELYWKYRLDYDRGTLNKTTYWHAIAKYAATEFTQSQIDAMNDADIRMWTALNPAMLAWVTQLQDAGFITGILSNIGDGISEWMVANFAWLAGFKHCTWSYQLDLIKPELAIYTKTVAALGVPAAEVFFLDDREENIDGAHAAGLQARQFTTLDELAPHLAALGLPTPKL